jgi:hypothetical protein
VRGEDGDVTRSRTPDKLERRVVAAAEAALAAQGFVSAIDVLTGMGWLPPGSVDRWRQGRVECLERVITASLPKISRAMAEFRRWAVTRELRPSETAYVARTRDRRPLRFSVSGDAAIERAYSTHWVSPRLSAARRKRLAERQSRPPDLVVISPINDWTCTLCAGTGGLLMMEDAGPVCLRCADMDHLVFLPAGDAALTRRAKQASRLSAVVVRFSRARRRYERQGVLVEEDALAAAEQACLADEEARRRRRERAAAARVDEDETFQTAFASEIVRLFPGCPNDRAAAIARHAGKRRSGRVGRTASGRALEEGAVTLAVVASVRHLDTGYDELLMQGVDRAAARDAVRDDVDRILEQWRPSPPFRPSIVARSDDI